MRALSDRRSGSIFDLNVSLDWNDEGYSLPTPLEISIAPSDDGIEIRFKEEDKQFGTRWTKRALIAIDAVTNEPYVLVWPNSHIERPICHKINMTANSPGQLETETLDIQKLAQEAVSNMGDVFYDPDEWGDEGWTTEEMMANVVRCVEDAIRKALSLHSLQAQTASAGDYVRLEIGGPVTKSVDNYIRQFAASSGASSIDIEDGLLVIVWDSIPCDEREKLVDYLITNKIDFNLKVGQDNGELIRYRTWMKKPIRTPATKDNMVAIPLIELFDLLESVTDLDDLRHQLRIKYMLSVRKYEVIEVVNSVFTNVSSFLP